MKSHSDKLDELTDDMRGTKLRLTDIEQDARQPRFVMEVDVPSDTKTRERTEGAAATFQAKHGDSCCAKRIQAGLTSSTSFGDDFTGPPDLPRSWDDALVDNDPAAPKSCLSPLEMRTPTAAGDRESLYNDEDHL